MRESDPIQPPYCGKSEYFYPFLRKKILLSFDTTVIILEYSETLNLGAYSYHFLSHARFNLTWSCVSGGPNGGHYPPCC